MASDELISYQRRMIVPAKIWVEMGTMYGTKVWLYVDADRTTEVAVHVGEDPSRVDHMTDDTDVHRPESPE